MTVRAQLDAAATLLDEGSTRSAIRVLRGSWEPELPHYDLVPLYCMWIRALCDAEEFQHAQRLADRAVEEFPREPDLLIALGNVHDLRGDLEGARNAFERAIACDLLGALQRYNLGAVLERLGEEERAERCYREAIALEQEPGTTFEATSALGAMLRRQGRIEEAALVYETFLDEEPLHVDMLVEHGICMSDLDCFDEALQRFELALTLDSEHASAWYNAAITQYRMGLVDDAISAMTRAYRADPTSPLTLAVLGSWHLSRTVLESADLDTALNLLYSAIDHLLELDCENLSASYASLVCEEVFEALWQRGRCREAREIARMAGQRDWITAHMLNTLNEADHGSGIKVTSFSVTARAEAGERPEHWPADAHGYTTGLTVLATDEDEARRYSLEYLRSLDPFPNIHFQIELILPEDLGEITPAGPTMEPRARGVVGVNIGRAYFRT